MRRPFAHLTIPLVFLVLAGSCKQPPTDTMNPANVTDTGATTGNSAVNEAAVNTCLAEFATAMSKHDFSALDRMWADEFTFVSHDGEMFTKAQLLDLLKSGTEKFESLVFDDVNIRTYGDTAVVTANSTQKATLEGKDHNGTARVSIVLVKMGHEWRIVLAQLAELSPATNAVNTSNGGKPTGAPSR